MDCITPLPRREHDTLVGTLCQEHLTREESLIADLLHSLRQVRDAFFQRDLTILPALQTQQQRMLHVAAEIAQARERFREALGDVLGVRAHDVTLRTVAHSLAARERDRLLARRELLAKQVREAEQLSAQNAVLLGYSRGFLACLFASLTGVSPGDRYGPQGERRGMLCGPFLEARG